MVTACNVSGESQEPRLNSIAIQMERIKIEHYTKGARCQAISIICSMFCTQFLRHLSQWFPKYLKAVTLCKFQ